MLSIIIPTLNEEKYLPLLLEEIKKQNFDDLEIIVADAGSKDKTVKIAKSYGCKIVSGGLPARGRNKGAKVAKSSLLLFMDADNVFLPENFLQNLIKEFKRKNLDVASFPICPKGNRFDEFAFGTYNWWVKTTQRFLAHATNSVLVKKGIFEKISGFDEKIKIGEDHDFVRRASKVGRFGFIETEPILTSIRRFETDGRFKTYSKYILAGLYMIFLGPVKADIFKYRFNDLKKSKKDYDSPTTL